MAFGEDVTGTAFQISLEMLRLFNRLERDIQSDLPRPELGCVWTLPGVVICEALPEVCGVTCVTLIGMVQALDHVSAQDVIATRRRTQPFPR